MPDVLLDNQAVIQEIGYWNNELQTNAQNNVLFELAFFRIFIKFESFLADSFMHYSLGLKSIKNYKPSRKLYFKDIEQLRRVLKREDQAFIDFSKRIEEVYDFIFKSNSPFEKLFSTASFVDNFRKMKLMRNYIAHESQEAKYRYVNSVLGSFGIQNFIEPHAFLRSIKRTENITYYSYFVNIINNYSKIVLKP